MKTLTSQLTKLKSRSRGNEADDSGRANCGVRLSMNLGSERRALLGTNQRDLTMPSNARRSGSWSRGSAFHRGVLFASSATGRALTKLTLAAVLLTTAVAARADWVSGYTRSNGTYVAPHYRTPANGSVYDNLSYRCYPLQLPGYVSPRSYGYGDSYSAPRIYSGTTTHYGNSSDTSLYGK